MFNEIEEYGDFADSKLNDHLFELYAQHNNLRPYSDEMMTEAYNAHRKILSEELEKKLASIIKSKKLEPAIQEGLLGIKRKYESSLKWNKKIGSVL